MANLKDTEINGNLNVSEDIQIGDVSVLESLNELNTKISNYKIEYTVYTINISTNAYVTPFTHYGNVDITNDSAIYGIPIGAWVNNSAGAPTPCSLELESNGKHTVRISSTSAANTLYVKWLKLN